MRRLLFVVLLMVATPSVHGLPPYPGSTCTAALPVPWSGILAGRVGPDAGVWFGIPGIHGAVVTTVRVSFVDGPVRVVGVDGCDGGVVCDTTISPDERLTVGSPLTCFLRANAVEVVQPLLNEGRDVSFAFAV